MSSELNLAHYCTLFIAIAGITSSIETGEKGETYMFMATKHIVPFISNIIINKIRIWKEIMFDSYPL